MIQGMASMLSDGVMTSHSEAADTNENWREVTDLASRWLRFHRVQKVPTLVAGGQNLTTAGWPAERQMEMRQVGAELLRVVRRLLRRNKKVPERRYEAGKARRVRSGIGMVLVDTAVTAPKLPVRTRAACIRRVELEVVACKCSLSGVIGERSRPYEPRTTQQKEQWRRVERWGLGRLADTEATAFTIGSLLRAMRRWQSGRHKGCKPPLEAVRAATSSGMAPTATASNTGHVWTYAGPLCERQLAAYLGTPQMAPVLGQLVSERVVSEAQMRALCGQATHGASMRVAVHRAAAKAGLQERPVTLAMLGAGVGFSWVQALQELGEGSCLSWVAEAEGVTAAAGRVAARWMGQSPEEHARAEDVALADMRWRVDGEIWTLRCAPFSQAASGAPTGVEEGLQELLAVATVAESRRSTFYVVETTAGLWRHRDIRLRYEGVLRAMDVQWEAIHTSPHRHAGVPVTRERIFYVGVRR